MIDFRHDWAQHQEGGNVEFKRCRSQRRYILWAQFGFIQREFPNIWDDIRDCVGYIGMYVYIEEKR
jgi:hypothetical protein